MILRWQSGNEQGPNVIRWQDSALVSGGGVPPTPTPTVGRIANLHQAGRLGFAAGR